MKLGFRGTMHLTKPRCEMPLMLDVQCPFPMFLPGYDSPLLIELRPKVTLRGRSALVFRH